MTLEHMASARAGRGDSKLTEAVDDALDDVLGAAPTELVEERPEPRDPTAEEEAIAAVRRLHQRGYGLP